MGMSPMAVALWTMLSIPVRVSEQGRTPTKSRARGCECHVHPLSTTRCDVAPSLPEVRAWAPPEDASARAVGATRWPWEDGGAGSARGARGCPTATGRRIVQRWATVPEWQIASATTTAVRAVASPRRSGIEQPAVATRWASAGVEQSVEKTSLGSGRAAPKASMAVAKEAETAKWRRSQAARGREARRKQRREAARKSLADRACEL